MRIVHPFIDNPFDFTPEASDPARHLRFALHPESHEFFNLVDAAGYQYWLRMVLMICRDSKVAIAIYAALLGAITPLCYYLWMRECLPDRKLALAGYAILALLPTWILYAGLFMQESLMLPLIGLSLWTNWRAVRLRSTPTLVAAGLLWGLTAATKPAVAPLLLLVWGWTVWRFVRSQIRPVPVAGMILATLLMVLAYSITPVRTYMRMHTFVLYPQDILNRVYFESGAAVIWVHIDCIDAYPDPIAQRFLTAIQSPAIADRPLRPLSDWHTHRSGTYNGYIGYLGKLPIVSPEVSLKLSDRLVLMGDGIIFFFFGDTWPLDDANQDRILNQLAALSRWLWAPLLAVVLFRVIKTRRVTPVIAFCLVYLLFFLLQQSVVMEGRYRMPWEGLAVAALLDSCWKRKDNVRQTKT